MRSILVDVDAGTDDALALMLLLLNEQHRDYKIVGITCVNGNTSVDNVIRNVLLILEALNRTDIPVYQGAETSILNEPKPKLKFHGDDGFADKEFPPPKTKVNTENAFVAINRHAEESEKLTIICLGPLTNIALALKTYPKLKSKLDTIWIMGGNYQGIGNVDGTSAEFNFFVDPEAAHIVLSEAGCEIVIFPWEPCVETPLTLEWRFKIFGNKTSRHMSLLDLIETDLYSEQSCYSPCDAFLAAATFESNVIASTRKEKLHVELGGKYSRGQCVILDGTPNVTIIEKLNFSIIQELFSELFMHAC